MRERAERRAREQRREPERQARRHRRRAERQEAEQRAREQQNDQVRPRDRVVVTQRNGRVINGPLPFTVTIVNGRVVNGNDELRAMGVDTNECHMM